jgi:polysaccharide biosynthesis/export protein
MPRLFALGLLIMTVAALPAMAQNRINTPEPAAPLPPTMASLPAQKIGTGDVVHVQVYDQKEFTRTARVDSDGNIQLPLLTKKIKALDLLPTQLEAVIAEMLRQEDFVLRPVVSVSVLEYNSRPVTVTGAVRTPTTFQAIGRITLLDAINKAGGLGTEAGAEILVIRRPEGSAQITRRILAKALIDEGDPDANVVLTGGEEVRVPERGRVYVLGSVKTPGSYPIQEGTDTTVLKALAMCGGLSTQPPALAYVVRRDDATGGKVEIPIQMKAIINRKSADIPLLASDILYVPEVKQKNPLLTAERIITAAIAVGTGVAILTLGR